jgi:MFS family permease
VRGSSAVPALPAYLGFAVFGAFWGVWGAAIPAIRNQTGVSEAQLGTALLFVGAGALPAMLVAGRVVDRWGQRAAGLLLAALGVTGVLVASAADDLLTLSLGLAVVGAVSGAADVAINAVAGSIQYRTSRPVISRSHACFSAAVVVASLATGALRSTGAPTPAAFVVLAVAAVLAAAVLVREAPRVPPVHDQPATVAGLRFPGRTRLLLVLGGLGAVGLAVENGHQSWSALYLGDVLGATPVASAAGPAVFAAVVALTRVSTGRLGSRWPILVLGSGALVAAAGTATLGRATSVVVGLLGLALAAAGTAVLLPTLLSYLTRQVPENVRGRATSVVSAVAYLGFLVGPVYVGFWAGALGLPGAMTALAGLAVALALGVPVALRGGTAGPEPRGTHGTSGASRAT